LRAEATPVLKPVYLTPTFAVAPALSAEDIADAARLGFKAILSNLPDGEDESLLSARAEAATAWRAGLKFRHVPAPKHDIFTDEVVEAMADAVAGLEGPVLAHCKSGQRSAIVWAAASARSQTVDCVLDALQAAGFDFAFLRDELEAQADRKRWLGTPAAALDCGCPEPVDLDIARTVAA
jgi:sulfide:quinone oxidoreductase